MNYKLNVCPYNDLFIYHLRGRFRDEDEKYLGKGFLGNWIEDEYSFLFFAQDPDVDIEKIIEKQAHINLLDKYYFTYEEWQGGGFEKTRVEEFIIIPPWETVRADTDGYKIILDPGVVFGNGLHPTTRDCLKALSYLKKHYNFSNVLDIGTGTGILSISAAALGATSVLAVDLNPLSVKTAENNVRINDFNDIIRVVNGRAENFINKNADLVLANIHYDVIKELMELRRFPKKGYSIFSGLMRSQAGDIRDRITNYNLTILYEWDHEMTWYTFLVGSDKNGR